MNNKSSEEIVKDLVAKSKAAQSIFEKYNQNQVDELVTAVAWSICKPSNNKKISLALITIFIFFTIIFSHSIPLQ